MDGAQDHVEADEQDGLFNGGARENPAQRDEDISPCFYIAHSKQTPAQVKVSSSTSCASLLTIAPYLFGMQVGCSIQANWRIKTRYKTILDEDLIVKRFSFADRTIFEVVVSNIISQLFSSLYLSNLTNLRVLIRKRRRNILVK